MASGIAIIQSVILLALDITVLYVLTLETSVVQGLLNTLAASGIGIGFLKYSDFQFIFIMIWIMMTIVLGLVIYRRLVETSLQSSIYEGY